jgi:hypothetical protein
VRSIRDEGRGASSPWSLWVRTMVRESSYVCVGVELMMWYRTDSCADRGGAARRTKSSSIRQLCTAQAQRVRLHLALADALF